MRSPGFLLALAAAWIAVADDALAQTAAEAADGAALTATRINPGQAWTLFFLLLGPIKIIVPFARLTRGCDRVFDLRLALRATGFAGLVLFVAAVVGVSMLDKYNMRPAELALAGGVIVFMVALRTVLEQISGSPAAPAPSDQPPSLRAAFSPLAFPVIVTPAGIAAVIVFMALAPDAGTKLLIAGLLALILALDLAAMLSARFIVQWATMPLQVFGAVLGIVQLALGLHLILVALGSLGIISYVAGPI